MTRVELFVVLLAVACLAAAAMLAYGDHRVRRRRSDAIEAVLDLARQQEQYFLRCGRYAARIALATDCAAGTLQHAEYSRNGWYRLIIGPPASTPSAFNARAVAAAGQPTYRDEECREFRVTQAGARGAQDADGGDSTAGCWR